MAMKQSEIREFDIWHILDIFWSQELFCLAVFVFRGLVTHTVVLFAQSDSQCENKMSQTIHFSGEKNSLWNEWNSFYYSMPYFFLLITWCCYVAFLVKYFTSNTTYYLTWLLYLILHMSIGKHHFKPSPYSYF